MRALLVFSSLLISLPAWAAQESEDSDHKAKVSRSTHAIEIDGQEIEYEASAGTILLENDEGEPQALMGFTAYQRMGQDRARRPIMFAYNGGPGSASLWLHMGILGPKRAVVMDTVSGSKGPFERVDNEFCVLDVCDVVLIDPVGTGFSKPIGEAKGEDFWGVDQDIRSVSQFIVQFVTQHGRWASPKYVLGESYGGMRTGGVCYHLLKQYSMALNGVILVSPFMEMVTGFSGMGVDLPHALFLPTFAATARYHGKLDPIPEDFLAFMEEVKEFALNEYAPALLWGRKLPQEKRKEIVAKLSRYTGLTESYWDCANLRVDEGQFTKELLRDRGRTVGRIDSRFSGAMINPLGENAVYDPMTGSIGPGYLASFLDYYRHELQVQDMGTYVVSANVFPKWDWSHRQPDAQMELPFPNTSIDLAYAMSQNPSMKVLVQQGYYDLATPHLATEYYLDHLRVNQELFQNIELEMYEAGHMMYVHAPSLSKYRRDLKRFIEGSL